MKKNILKFTTMAILSALSIVLVLSIHFPLIPAVPFLEYDPGDIPIILSAFIFGPVSGIVVTLLVSIIQGVTVSAGSGIIGILMHVLSTGALCLTTGLIYKKRSDNIGLLLSVIFGTIVMTIVMVGWNLIFTPLFLGQSIEQVLGILIYIIAFNFIKALVNSTLAVLVFKALNGRFSVATF